MASQRAQRKYRQDPERQLKPGLIFSSGTGTAARLEIVGSVAKVIATVGLVLSAAACGGSPSSHVAQLGTTATATASSSFAASATKPAPALAYATCMRSKGVPNYPDPGRNSETPSGLPKVGLQQLGVSLSQFETAEGACRHALPAGDQSSSAAAQQTLSKLVRFAQCMRSHRVSNWPDPTAAPSNAVAMGAPPYMFQMQGLQGLDGGGAFSPRITAALHECFHLTGLTNQEVPWTG